jgi:hypothetical protein
MVGQSNMAGRGLLTDVQPILDEQIKLLVNGRWQTMWEPSNNDRPTAGIGLTASFAASCRLKNRDIQIGLIPCADGGTSLDDWAVDGELFRHAVFQAKLAMRSSALKAILWHQGENDSFQGRSKTYRSKLNVIVDAFISELGCPEIIFIAGGLGAFLSSGRYGKYFTEYTAVNEALQEFAATRDNCYFVTASGLNSNPDGLHFDAMSQRKFGIRYFEAYHTKKSILEPLGFEDELLNNIYQRPLTKAEQAIILEIRFAKGEISATELQSQLDNLS